MLNTRMEVDRVLRRHRFKLSSAATKGILATALALMVAFMPAYPGLEPAARTALFILVLAAGLWVTEAIPAFAVGILIIGLEIALLGRPDGIFAETNKDWQIFVAPWSSPLVWLFLGGLILARAAAKTQLDLWLSSRVLKVCEGKPAMLMFAIMLMTFVFSMFMSNTATAAMMVTVCKPMLDRMPLDHRYGKALLLAVPVAANIGGMATLIGTPPNAIAAAALEETDKPIDFLGWMMAGLPPACVLLMVLFGFLWFTSRDERPIDTSIPMPKMDKKGGMRDRIIVIVGFVLTIGMWLTGPLHGIPTTVVAFIPIVVFTFTGVIGANDIRNLQWDVLMLLAGGMALGVAVSETGLATWLVAKIPTEGIPVGILAFGMALFACALSNFMSNTATANILVPIVAGLVVGAEARLVVPLALAASAAMCLPISTPPNAIAFSTERLKSNDFIVPGIIAGVGASVLGAVWCHFLYS